MSEIKTTRSQRKREAKRQAVEQSKREFAERVLSVDYLTHTYRTGPYAEVGTPGKIVAVMAGELLRLRGLDPEELVRSDLEHIHGE